MKTATEGCNYCKRYYFNDVLADASTKETLRIVTYMDCCSIFGILGNPRPGDIFRAISYRRVRSPPWPVPEVFLDFSPHERELRESREAVNFATRNRRFSKRGKIMKNLWFATHIRCSSRKGKIMENLWDQGIGRSKHAMHSRK